MMERSSKFCLNVLKITSMLIALFIFIQSTCVTAFALNENYTVDEYYQWIDIDEQYNYQKGSDGFDGLLKKVADEDDGCFYIYFKFFDKRIADGDDSAVVLTFNVKNNEREYQFSVNKDGFVDTGDNDIRAVELVSNFDNFSSDANGGEIFVGFQLKNSRDRMLTNYVSCSYAAGVNTTAVLFDNEVLDLYVEPTTKATTTKVTTTKTTKTKTSTTKKETTRKKNVEVTTKSNTVKSNKNSVKTTKFKSNGDYKNSEAKTDVSKTTTVVPKEVVSKEIEMSTVSKTTLIASAISLAAGLIVLTVSTFVKSNKNKDNEENDEESSS